MTGGGLTILVTPGESFTVVGTPVPVLHWHAGPVVTKKGWPMPQEYTISREQKLRLFIAPTTPGGAPAPIDGQATWTVTGPCTLEPIDATSVWCVSPDAGTDDSRVDVEADADLGAGVVTLRDTAIVHTTDPMATHLGMGADAPILKTPAP